VLGVVALRLFFGDDHHLEAEDRVTAPLEARDDLAGEPATTASALARIKVRSSAIADLLFVPDDDAPLARRSRACATRSREPPSRRARRRQTASTNDDAAELLGDPSAAGATLVAELQTAGRGRKPGRSWIAPAGSALLFTTILPVASRTDALWAVPFWTALAVADGVEEGCGVRLDLRWPNDADIEGRKAAGILCTSRVAGADAYVGCGIGLNVRRPPDATIAAIEPPPAYLSDLAPRVAREDVLAGSSARWTGCSRCSNVRVTLRARGKNAPRCAGSPTACGSTPTAASSKAWRCSSIATAASCSTPEGRSASCISPTRA
jgi:biotin-(acetyl-CoA carboxylase) ligase